MRVLLSNIIKFVINKYALYRVENDGFYKLIENAEKQCIAGNMNGVLGFLKQSETTLNTRLSGYKDEAKGQTQRAPKAKKIADILEDVKKHVNLAEKSAKENKSNEVRTHLEHIKEFFMKTEPLVRDYQTIS